MAYVSLAYQVERIALKESIAYPAPVTVFVAVMEPTTAIVTSLISIVVLMEHVFPSSTQWLPAQKIVHATVVRAPIQHAAATPATAQVINIAPQKEPAKTKSWVLLLVNSPVSANPMYAIIRASAGVTTT